MRDKIIAGGLLEGFRAVLPHGVYPVAFLFLEIPHEEIDVNVHPSKTEVRFRRSEAVKEVIAEAIRVSLRNAGIVREEIQSSISQIQNPADYQNTETSSANQSFEQTQIEFQIAEDKPANQSFRRDRKCRRQIRRFL